MVQTTLYGLKGDKIILLKLYKFLNSSSTVVNLNTVIDTTACNYTLGETIRSLYRDLYNDAITISYTTVVTDTFDQFYAEFISKTYDESLGELEHLGHTNDGHTNNGHTNDGHTNDGHTNDGHTNDGHTNDGHTNDGHTNDGHTNDGHTNDGHTNDGHTNGGNNDCLNFLINHIRATKVSLTTRDYVKITNYLLHTIKSDQSAKYYVYYNTLWSIVNILYYHNHDIPK